MGKKRALSTQNVDLWPRFKSNRVQLGDLFESSSLNHPLVLAKLIVDASGLETPAEGLNSVSQLVSLIPQLPPRAGANFFSSFKQNKPLVLFVRLFEEELASQVDDELVHGVIDALTTLSASPGAGPRTLATWALALIARGCAESTERRRRAMAATAKRVRDADGAVRRAAAGGPLPLAAASLALRDSLATVRSAAVRNADFGFSEDPTELQKAVLVRCFDEEAAVASEAVTKLCSWAAMDQLNQKHFGGIVALVFSPAASVASAAFKFVDKHVFVDPGFFGTSDRMLEAGAALMMLTEFMAQFPAVVASDLLTRRLIDAAEDANENGRRSPLRDFGAFVKLLFLGEDAFVRHNPLSEDERTCLLLLLLGVLKKHPTLSAVAISAFADCDFLTVFRSDRTQLRLALEIVGLLDGEGARTEDLADLLRDTCDESLVDSLVAALSKNAAILQTVAADLLETKFPLAEQKLSVLARFTDVTSRNFDFLAGLLESIDRQSSSLDLKANLCVAVLTGLRLFSTRTADEQNLDQLLADLLLVTGRACLWSSPEAALLAFVLNLYVEAFAVQQGKVVTSNRDLINKHFVRLLAAKSSHTLAPGQVSVLTKVDSWETLLGVVNTLQTSQTDLVPLLAITAVKLLPTALLKRHPVGLSLFRLVDQRELAAPVRDVLIAAIKSIKAEVRDSETGLGDLWDLVFGVVQENEESLLVKLMQSGGLLDKSDVLVAKLAAFMKKSKSNSNCLARIVSSRHLLRDSDREKLAQLAHDLF